jgi:hypothetical protein
MPCCVGCSRAELGHELCALCESWYTTVVGVLAPDTSNQNSRPYHGFKKSQLCTLNFFYLARNLNIIRRQIKFYFKLFL